MENLIQVDRQTLFIVWFQTPVGKSTFRRRECFPKWGKGCSRLDIRFSNCAQVFCSLVWLSAQLDCKCVINLFYGFMVFLLHCTRTYNGDQNFPETVLELVRVKHTDFKLQTEFVLGTLLCLWFFLWGISIKFWELAYNILSWHLQCHKIYEIMLYIET